MNHLVGLESRKIKSVRYRVRDGKKREGKRASRRRRRRLHSSLSFSLVLPCAAILLASAISSSVRGFALGTGLTAEAGSQAMEEIIGGNYSKQKVEECRATSASAREKKSESLRGLIETLSSQNSFPPPSLPQRKSTMEEPPQEQQPPSTSDAFLYTIDGEEVPLEEARKLSRNYK